MLSIKQGFAGLPGGLADAQDPECGEATDAGYAETRLDRLKFGVPPSGRRLRTWENQAHRCQRFESAALSRQFAPA